MPPNKNVGLDCCSLNVQERVIISLLDLFLNMKKTKHKHVKMLLGRIHLEERVKYIGMRKKNQ